MILSAIFVSVAVLLCVVSVLAILGITDVYLSGHDAVERDGMMPGRTMLDVVPAAAHSHNGATAQHHAGVLVDAPATSASEGEAGQGP